MTAAVALQQPQRGIQARAVGDTPFHGDILAISANAGSIAETDDVAGAADAQPAALQLDEAYVRGHDLVVDYTNAAAALKLRVYWNAEFDPAVPDLVVLTMTASLRTDLLDVEPVVRGHSRLVPSAIQRLDASLKLVPVDATDAPVDVSADRCLATVFSLPGDVVYAEMAHPADVPRSLLTRSATDALATLTHEMFAERLEKGVIVRARVQGLVMLAGAEVAARLGHQYHRLTTMAPPLDA
ncbi:MAG: hypothetical protein R3C10_14465 [Pirellulales bacterium]|nr:hypothetical protein [Planctomycetales bacterium]